MTRLMKVFKDNLEWKQTRNRYLVDRLKPPGYKGDCEVKNIKVGCRVAAMYQLMNDL